MGCIRMNEDSPFLKNLVELKSIDEITYCYVLAKLDLSLSQTEAISIFESNINDDRIGLLIWSFGQLRLWDVLLEIEPKLPEIEKCSFNKNN